VLHVPSFLPSALHQTAVASPQRADPAGVLDNLTRRGRGHRQSWTAGEEDIGGGDLGRVGKRTNLVVGWQFCFLLSHATPAAPAFFPIIHVLSRNSSRPFPAHLLRALSTALARATQTKAPPTRAHRAHRGNNRPEPKRSVTMLLCV
jgi:hypothetical protein